MKNKVALFIAVLTLGLTSCKKEFDAPPQNIVAPGDIITIDSLRNMYQGTDIHFTTNLNVYGVITADEMDGNFYKNVFVQNGDAAINLRLLNSGGLYVGDSVRIYLNGTVLTKYNGMLQLDSVDVDVNVIKQSAGNATTPTNVNITDLDASWQSRLIKIDSVEFDALELSMTYADAVNQQSEDRTLTDCAGNTVIVRTSGYALYANQLLAQGNGSLVAIVGVYGSTIQLYIRDISEVQMTAPRCTGSAPYLVKNFEDNSITSGGWTQQNVTGTINWATNGVGASFGSKYGQCTNYVSGANQACETWYISPSVNLASSVNPVFSFYSGCNYSGAAMQVYVSTDYTSGAPSTGTWTLLSPTLSGGSWTWTGSGMLNLSAYKTSNVHVAFKYTGSSTDGKTWEIDEIYIQEN